jgi:hypothetical protein
MNFVSRQAQEAILDPNLPETFKDEVVGAAVEALLKIAEKRGAYNADHIQGKVLKQSKTVYQAKNSD